VKIIGYMKEIKIMKAGVAQVYYLITIMKESAKSVYKYDAINYYDQPMQSSRYDPVKVRWEDKICHDHYRKMVNRLTEAGEKLRIFDLGCGIRYGYHLISIFEVIP